jgi:hypothetical protein
MSSNLSEPRPLDPHFSWGVTIAGYRSESKYLFFRPMGNTPEDDEFRLHSRRCERCGNVLLFTPD